MNNEPEFSLSEKSAERIAVKLLSTRMMRAIDKVVGGRRKDIAKRLGVSESHVSQLFSGDKILNLPKIHKIQKAYRVQADITFRPIRTMHIVPSEYNVEYTIVTSEVLRPYVEPTAVSQQAMG